MVSTNGVRAVPRGQRVVRRRALVVLVALVVLGPGLQTTGLSPARAAGQGGWRAVESMQAARAGHTATLLADGRHLLVVGGVGAVGRALRSAELYDTQTGRWSTAGSLTTARSGHTATLLPDGRVLVAGGRNDQGVALASAEVFEPASGGGTWSEARPMSACQPASPSCTARAGHTATQRSDGTVLVVGGAGTTAQLYAPSANTWSAAPSMATPRSGHTATVVNPSGLLDQGHLVVAGGEPLEERCIPQSGNPSIPPASAVPGAVPLDSRPVARPERYPASGAGIWAPTAPAHVLRRHHAAVAISATRVLVAGGEGCPVEGMTEGDLAAITSAEVYDAAGDTWEQAEPMATARARHTATPVVAGGQPKVMVIGGIGRDGAVLGSSELFDPATGEWSAGGALVTARADHGTVVVGTGLLAVGGTRQAGEPRVVSRSVESFAPDQATPPPSVARVEPPAGRASGGTPVVLTGAGFSDGAQVRFGNRPAQSVRVESPTRVTAVSPPQEAGSDPEVAVVVTTGAGTSTPTSAARFSYVDGAGQWAPAGEIGAARVGLRAVTLTGPTCTGLPTPRWCGHVLVLGSDGGEAVRSHRYNPRSGRWERANLTVSEPGATATLLLDGKVLVVGDAATLYDPAADAGTSSGETTGRRHHAAVRLAGGQVLVVGGSSPAGSIDATAQLYDPEKRLGERWTPAGALGTARTGLTATLLHGPACDNKPLPQWCGQVLVAGGSASDGTPVAASELYNPAATGDPWSAAATVGGQALVARSGHTATALPDGRVLVAGGFGTGGEPLASAQVYDPASGTWAAAGPMVDARAGHTATVVEGAGCEPYCGQVLVSGGTGAAGDPLAAAELYDPAAAARPWRGTGPLVTPRSAHAVALLGGGRLLAVAGYERHGDEVAPGSSAEVFEPVALPVVSGVAPVSGPTFGGTSVTVTGAGLAQARVRFGGVAAVSVTRLSDNQVIAVTPPQSQGTVDVVVETDRGKSRPSPASTFSYASGTWADGEAMSACGAPCTARLGHTATPLGDGRVLVAGGEDEWGSDGAGDDSPALASAQIYEPSSGAWRPTTPMTSPRAFHTATLLVDGRVLVAGGNMQQHGSSQAVQRGAELYDPRTGTWTPTGALRTARFRHTATLLHDGRVLVTGGTAIPQNLRPLDSTELYDPKLGIWSPVASLSDCKPSSGASGEAGCGARVDHTATLLPSGRVLVVGGWGVAPDCPDPDALEQTLSCWDIRPVASAQIYEPTSGTWWATGRMAAHRAGHSAILLDREPCGARCGMVLVVGGAEVGVNGGGGLRSAELYDMATGRWSMAPSASEVRVGHTATRLGDGTVLVAGAGPNFVEWYAGIDSSTSAEVFDPVAGDWRLTTFLATARSLHTATVLDGPICRTSGAPRWCGSVLVAGGTSAFRFETREVPLHPWVPSPGLSIESETYRVMPAVDPAEVYTPAPLVTAVTPALGPVAGGTPVGVTGTGFAGAKSVQFGSVPANSFQRASSSQLTTNAPIAHQQGPVEVAVTNAGGTSATLVPRPGAPRFIYVGDAGRVTDLRATRVPARPETEVELRFTAPDDGTGPPGGTVVPATDYQIRVAEAPITDAAGFAAAFPLCEGDLCRFPPALSLSMLITGFEPGTTVHFALRALNPFGQPGPLSNSAEVTTAGTRPPSGGGTRTVRPTAPPTPPPACAPAVPGSGQIAYRGGVYSLISLPPGTVPGAQSTLYHWLDQGAGGSYGVKASTDATEAGVGYWAWFRCPTVVQLSGPGLGSVSVPLGAYHASMIGNPSGTGPATLSGHDFAARWDPDLNDGAGGYVISGYRDTQSLAVGEAAWAFSYRDTTLEVTQ